MQTVLEQGSIDKPLTFDGLIQLSFIPVCSLNTCNISVKLCRGFALQCFSLLLALLKISVGINNVMVLNNDLTLTECKLKFVLFSIDNT